MDQENTSIPPPKQGPRSLRRRLRRVSDRFDRLFRDWDKLFSNQEQETDESPSKAKREIIHEFHREKETIREIVKVRCQHCGGLCEENLDGCPSCGAPL